jgi:hypothetical protein
LKPKKPNIATKQISEPNVAKMVETHFELDTTIIEVDNQMAIIQVQVGKNIVEDVLIEWKSKREHYNMKPLNKIRLT